MEEEVQIVNRAGMHARPAAEFVKLAGGFAANVTIEKDGLEVNGKSIMGVLMLAAEQGSTLKLTASGEDAEAAVEALADLVKRGFEEN
ncbi:MAG: HPr family phosphocarrier protein [Gemmatimonadales bacterium]|nr:HPr family phosphocarrier protein [Gemmatimonadales bacterium]MBT3497827.1 HPr family phosphocarrier protein [Gemmatimonadales bacterium]MBT3774650.1 HPr family phosphocarrier protein [Gemmatimonadales bacterium]MBT3959158.1 HPr family phosphocarrier protein [Gemmatimonadales bacterium]MBT4189331.1 HPr family phosphocarrier protein [Gemmatimonadales bacterium]